MQAIFKITYQSNIRIYDEGKIIIIENGYAVHIDIHTAEIR